MRKTINDAIRDKNIEKLQRLLDEGFDVNSIEEETGWTPLHFAASFGHVDVAEMLIACGADVNMSSNSGFTPLHIAVDQGNVPLVKLFIDKDTNVNSKNNAGLTPLNLAENLFRMTQVDEYRDIVKLLRT